MIQQQRNFFIKFAYIVIDLLIAYVCIYVACLLRAGTLPFSVTVPSIVFEEQNPFRFIFLFWILSIVFLNNSYRLYQTRREVLEGVEIWIVIKSICLSSLIVVVTLYATKIQGFPRTVFAIATTLLIIASSVWRVLKRIFVDYLVRNGYNNVNALIIGAGKVGIALAKEITTRPSLGIKLVGFLDDFKQDNPDEKDIKILGKISDFLKVTRREFISKVFITIHHDHQVFLRLLEEAKVLGVAVRVVPQSFDLISCEFAKYNIGLIPILEYAHTEFRKQMGKRFFDLVVSMLSWIALIPIFVVIAIIIKLDSRGPVFYHSRRYGRKGKIFDMLKFRTMIQDADQTLLSIREQSEVDGPIFKMKNDPRVTKVGRFLRKYSLDELPQIINVLNGDMSLVGPRPLPIDQIEKEDLRQLKRLEVRPGITGLWQIRGRSDISFSRLVKWDVWYINNWSFWLDLNIIFQTIPVVCQGKGAY